MPESAKVYLAGMPTKQTGIERTFATTHLKAGEGWEGYTVRVELDQDGQQLVQERTLSIKGGKSYELAFVFDSQDDLKIAQLDK